VSFVISLNSSTIGFLFPVSKSIFSVDRLWWFGIGDLQIELTIENRADQIQIAIAVAKSALVSNSSSKKAWFEIRKAKL
jgi:hypothetical protein